MTAIDKVQYLQIGVQGENIANDFKFDMTAWAEKYPNATFHILFCPYNESDVSPQVSTYDSETKVLTWTVGAGATAVVGVGYTEVRAQDGEGLVKKTRIIPTAVENSVSGVEVNPPAAYAAWVTNVLNAGAAIVALSHGTEINFSISDGGHLVYSYTDEDEETVTVDLGPVDAYAVAVEAGYPRTRAQFEDELAHMKDYSDIAEAAAEAAEICKNYAQTFVGAPRTAATADDMTDESLIYVFTGTTTASLTNGHWYFYDGEEWSDGGVYNSTALTTDTTLTVSGAAADAKVAGDKLTELKNAIKATGTEKLTFEKGNISSSTGENTASSTRIRTPGYYCCPFGFSFTVPTGFKAYLYYYAEQTAGSICGSSREWKTGNVEIDAIHGNYMRIVVAKSNDASISPSDIASAINITLNKVSDKTLTQEDKAADAKTVGDKIQMITSDANAMKNGIFRDEITFTITWTYGEGVTLTDGTNYSTDRACRTGFTSFDVPFVVNMNDTDYEYLMWVYRNNSANYRTYSPTEQKFVQGLTLVNPNVGLNSMYKICFRRADRTVLSTDTTDPNSDASKIIAALSFFEMTDKTLTKEGYPADSKVVGIEIANINNLIMFESVPEYTVKNGNINTETGMNTSTNKTKRIRVDGNSSHQKMPTYAGIKVVVPSGKKLYAYAYSNDTYTQGYEGGSGWLEPGTYTFAEYVYYRFVIAFTDDSVIDPEDVGDVIITNVSMTDETLTQKGKPADAYIVGDKLSNLQVFDNLSWGMANVIANSEQVKSVKWTPVGNMPRLGDGNGYFPLTEQTGLPYSSARDQDKMIGMDVSIHTFMTAVKDPNSVLYTRRSTVSNSACYYGTVCSGMINVAMGINLDLTNYYLSESDMFETVPMQSITEGDMIWVDGHCALVLKARRDNYGRINEVTIREEWPPVPRDVTYNSWESFLSKRPGYIARRFKDIAGVPYTAIPYVQNFDEEPEEIIYPDVQTEFGDAAVFMSGEDVKVNVINSRDFSSIVVDRDGITVQTVTTIAGFTISNVQAGSYTITATGTEHESVSTFFVVDATASFNTSTGVVTFSSTNATPALVNVYNLPSNRRITCKPIILTDADRTAGQINVSEYMDVDYQYAKVTFQTQYGTAVWYSETHSKWNPIT